MLLERLDGSAAAGDVAERIGIPADEAADFLDFAAREGILKPA
jgi:hypothetical protein